MAASPHPASKWQRTHRSTIGWKKTWTSTPERSSTAAKRSRKSDDVSSRKSSRSPAAKKRKANGPGWATRNSRRGIWGRCFEDAGGDLLLRQQPLRLGETTVERLAVFAAKAANRSQTGQLTTMRVRPRIGFAFKDVGHTNPPIKQVWSVWFPRAVRKRAGNLAEDFRSEERRVGKE